VRDATHVTLGPEWLALRSDLDGKIHDPEFCEGASRAGPTRGKFLDSLGDGAGAQVRGFVRQEPTALARRARCGDHDAWRKKSPELAGNSHLRPLNPVHRTSLRERFVEGSVLTVVRGSSNESYFT
jgi:hypothetical protein